MGGMGSGPQRHGGKKWTVEGCHTLDTSDLARLKLLVPGERAGSLHWGEGEKRATVGYSLAVEESWASLRLNYRLVRTDEQLQYSIQMVTTPCQFGGRRWWFICPLVLNGVACGRRVRKLYLPGRYFGCRTCLDLTYTSTQESDRKVYAAVRSGGILENCTSIRGMSVGQLGFALKVIRFHERRSEKIRRRTQKDGALGAS